MKMKKANNAWSTMIFFFIAGALTVSWALAENFSITSPDFRHEETLPLWCAMPAAGGRNLSPLLEWTDPPKGIKSFALVVIDEHPVAKRWIHWIVVNIPSDVRSLPRGASRQNMPSGAVELQNSYGFAGYGGPQPPPGTGHHRYVFTLYALNVEKLNIPSNLTADGFEKTVKSHIISRAQIVGIFER